MMIILEVLSLLLTVKIMNFVVTAVLLTLPLVSTKQVTYTITTSVKKLNWMIKRQKKIKKNRCFSFKFCVIKQTY